MDHGASQSLRADRFTSPIKAITAFARLPSMAPYRRLREMELRDSRVMAVQRAPRYLIVLRLLRSMSPAISISQIQATIGSARSMRPQVRSIRWPAALTNPSAAMEDLQIR